MATTEEVIEGLKILAKYPENNIAVGHDVIYAGPSDVSVIAKEDTDKLDELGWHIDSEFECWARFV